MPLQECTGGDAVSNTADLLVLWCYAGQAKKVLQPVDRVPPHVGQGAFNEVPLLVIDQHGTKMPVPANCVLLLECSYAVAGIAGQEAIPYVSKRLAQQLWPDVLRAAYYACEELLNKVG